MNDSHEKAFGFWLPGVRTVIVPQRGDAFYNADEVLAIRKRAIQRRTVALQARVKEIQSQIRELEGQRRTRAPLAESASVAPTVTLTEAVDLSEASVDPTGHVLENVVLIREGESQNGRYYSGAVLRKAIPVFNGVRAFADHPSKQGAKNRPERSVREITGWYSNVRFEAGAIRADRQFTFNEAGKDVWALAQDIAEGRAPASLAGLSINATGHATKGEINGKQLLIVEAITGAFSVDDVTTPAAGGAYLA